MDYEERFGDFVMRKLAERGLSQRGAASAMGVRPSMVSSWVHNHVLPRPSNASKLAALLVVDEDEMLIRAGHRTRRDTDVHPKRAELLEAARQLPLSEADMAIEFLIFLRGRAQLQRGPRREASPSTPPDTDTEVD